MVQSETGDRIGLRGGTIALKQLLESMRGCRAVVIGDLMLDEYIFGSATRISPEAPVMVIRHSSSRQVPGGAANVARNVLALGGEVAVVGLVGDDEAGRTLTTLLGEAHCLGGLVVDASRLTTRKTRVVADHSHQVLRIDSESELELSADIEAQLTVSAIKAVQDADVVVLSDYRKGALTTNVVQTIIASAKGKGIPVLANPKPQTLERYSGASLVTLNRLEAGIAIGLDQAVATPNAYAAALQIRKAGSFESALVTLGEDGAVAAAPEMIRILAPRVEVADPAGAGDTVISALALGAARAGFTSDVFQLAINLAAAVVQHVGVAVPSESDLARID